MAKTDVKNQKSEAQVEEENKDRDKVQVSDNFPVWEKTRHKRSQHPGFC